MARTPRLQRPTTPPEEEHSLIARQPILDRRGEVSGYELLARSADGTAGFAEGGGDRATYRTVSNGFLLFGLDRLAHGKTTFINLTREVLFSEAVTALPARQVVLEILEDVVPDDMVVARCRSLRRQGYRIALDDFADVTLSHPLLDVADIVKVEFPGTTAYEQGALAEALKRRGIVALAEKVAAYAAMLADRSRTSQMVAKKMIDSLGEPPSELCDALRPLYEGAFQSADFVEGRAAFLEKRPPAVPLRCNLLSSDACEEHPPSGTANVTIIDIARRDQTCHARPPARGKQRPV